MLVIALKWNVYVSYKQQASKEELQSKKCSVTLSSKESFGKMPWWIDQQCKNCLVEEIVQRIQHPEWLLLFHIVIGKCLNWNALAYLWMKNSKTQLWSKQNRSKSKMSSLILKTKHCYIHLCFSTLTKFWFTSIFVLISLK